MHLTDLVIRGLPFAHGQKDYTDDQIAGLALRIGKRTKTFMLVTGTGKARKRVRLGHYPHCSLQEARKKAFVLIGKREEGGVAEVSTPFDDALERFLKGYAEKNKPSTVYETERLLKRHLAPTFKGKKLGDATKRKLVTILDDIESVSIRRHFYTAAYTFFRWCRRYDNRNPLEGVEKPAKSPARTRLLSDKEFVEVWGKSLSSGTYGLLVRCLLASGQRLNQIASLHSDYIDRGKRVITWPASLMKTNREFIFPYGDLLHSLLPQGEGLLFPNDKGGPWDNWTDPHLELLALTKIPHFTRHDCRRFYSSTHSAIGTQPHIRELLLSHALGNEVSRTYDLYSYLGEKRTAQEAYETHLSTVLHRSASA